RRITVTSVDVSLVLTLGPKFHFLGGRKGKSGRADNLRHDGAVDAAAVGFAAVNGLGLGTELCELAGFHGEERAPSARTKAAAKLAVPRQCGRAVVSQK